MERKCLRKSCEVLFEPNKPKQLFCSAKCRVYHSRDKKKEIPELENLIPKGEIKKQVEYKPSIEQKLNHNLWKYGDPKENSGAFFLKYNCMNYEELSKLKE